MGPEGDRQGNSNAGSLPKNAQQEVAEPVGTRALNPCAAGLAMPGGEAQVLISAESVGSPGALGRTLEPPLHLKALETA